MYGDEKAREMARSILPSTYRGAKKSASRTRRQYRRKSKQISRSLANNPDLWDESEVFYEDRRERIKINQKVRRRQGADKLNHFQRWALVKTDGLEPDARLAKMMTVLPDGLVGWHARTHLEGMDEFKTNRTRYWSEPDGRWPHFHPFEGRYKEQEPDWVSLLQQVIGDQNLRQKLQQVLNDSHKQVWWVDQYGEPELFRKETWDPPKRSKWGGQWYGGYWDVKVRITPVVISKTAVGPRGAPEVPARPRDAREFWELLEAAEEAKGVVPSAGWVQQKKVEVRNSRWDQRAGLPKKKAEPSDINPAHILFWTREPEYVSRTDRRNPSWHPEWLKAAKEFLRSI